eukprot:m.37548 g.37548  ORF g.37548 m.37548 type:complete len:417 (-) comp6742_c0_seq1:155-1405(-)
MAVVKEMNLINDLKLSASILLRLMSKIEDSYGNFPTIPYHNNVHAADVVHSIHYLINNGLSFISFTPLEKLAAILAAAAHDVDHPSVNNSYLQEAWSPLAVLYNNKSILENHHAATFFSSLLSEGHNVIDHLGEKSKKRFRNLVISMILSTDMAKHGALISQFHHFTDEQKTTFTTTIAQSKDGSKNLPSESGEEVSMNASRRVSIDLDLDQMQKGMVLEFTLHAADLGNSTKEWVDSKKWSERIVTEFFNQGDLEREKGVPLGPVNDRFKVTLPQSQLGFIDFLASPVWELWEKFTKQKDHMFTKALASNRNNWQKMKDAVDGKTETETKQTKFKSISKSFKLLSRLRKGDIMRFKEASMVMRVPPQKSGAQSRHSFMNVSTFSKKEPRDSTASLENPTLINEDVADPSTIECIV